MHLEDLIVQATPYLPHISLRFTSTIPHRKFSGESPWGTSVARVCYSTKHNLLCKTCTYHVPHSPASFEYVLDLSPVASVVQLQPEMISKKLIQFLSENI